MMKSDVKRVVVIGLGYIGLPTAAMFASRGLEVLGVDIDERVVNIINGGNIHIVEPGLGLAVRDVVASGCLRASCVPEPGDVFIIAVPTPFTGDAHDPDLSYIESAARSIANVIVPGNLVILESTSPVGATEFLASILSELRSDLKFPASHGEASDIRIAHCPERVLPGRVMEELVTNDRVIGGMTLECARQAADLYRLFVTGDCLLASNCRVAEMAKLAENAYRDVNIAFANELSIICEALQINVWELIALANRHPRVDILQPGPGVGGHCIAVDPWFIVSSAPELAKLIPAARSVNESKPKWVIEQILSAKEELRVGEKLNERDIEIAIFGLAFKKDIDDLRESPAIEITEFLAASFSGKINVVEPNIEFLPASLRDFDNLTMESFDAAIERSQILILLVDHSEFSQLDQRRIRNKKVIDTRGLWL